MNEWIYINEPGDCPDWDRMDIETETRDYYNGEWIKARVCYFVGGDGYAFRTMYDAFRYCRYRIIQDPNKDADGNTFLHSQSSKSNRRRKKQ